MAEAARIDTEENLTTRMATVKALSTNSIPLLLSCTKLLYSQVVSKSATCRREKLQTSRRRKSQKLVADLLDLSLIEASQTCFRQA